MANYIELPVFALLYIAWRLIKRAKIPTLQQIDLDTSRFVNTPVEEEMDRRIVEREQGKFRFAWRAWSWVA